MADETLDLDTIVEAAKVKQIFMSTLCLSALTGLSRWAEIESVQK
jgi:hypothetical protein